MPNLNNKLTLHKDVSIPDITPLTMNAPVMFFAPFIDSAIDRGVYRLKRHIQSNPSSNSWIRFGWFDGGLSSSFVGMPIGAFRLKDMNVEFTQDGEENAEVYFSIEFEKNWDDMRSICKETLIQGYDLSYHEKKLEILTAMNVVNHDPTK